MTCRVARSSQHLPLINLVFCSECGSADLEGCYTSKALGPHLCLNCTLSIVKFETTESMTRSPMTMQPVA